MERLHALATWCASAKLFAARAEVYEGILACEPDDEVARKWLRYQRASGRHRGSEVRVHPAARSQPQPGQVP